MCDTEKFFVPKEKFAMTNPSISKGTLSFNLIEITSSFLEDTNRSWRTSSHSIYRWNTNPSSRVADHAFSGHILAVHSKFLVTKEKFTA